MSIAPELDDEIAELEELLESVQAENAKLKALLKNAVAREEEANRGWSTAARERDALAALLEGEE